MIEYLGHKLIRQQKFKSDSYFKCLCCDVLMYQYKQAGPDGPFEYLYFYAEQWLDLDLTCEEIIIKKLLE
jgi:hypothetical protein